MKIACFADLHLLGPAHEKALSSLEWVIADAEQRGCACIIGAGDIFNTGNLFMRGENSADIIGQVNKILDELTIPLYLIPGQHDYKGGTEPAIKIFKGTGIYTFCLDRKIEIGDVCLFLCPWSRGNSEEIIKKLLSEKSPEKHPIIFIGHGQLIGARLPAGHIFETGGDFPIREEWFAGLDLMNKDFVRLGDFHNRSDGNPGYIGALLAQDWRDANIIPGYEILDTENHLIEFIENPISDIYIQRKIKSREDITSIILESGKYEKGRIRSIAIIDPSEIKASIESVTLELEDHNIIVRIEEGRNVQLRTETPESLGINIHEPVDVIRFWGQANGMSEDDTGKIVEFYKKEMEESKSCLS